MPVQWFNWQMPQLLRIHYLGGSVSYGGLDISGHMWPTTTYIVYCESNCFQTSYESWTLILDTFFYSVLYHCSLTLILRQPWHQFSRFTYFCSRQLLPMQVMIFIKINTCSRIKEPVLRYQIYLYAKMM